MYIEIIGGLLSIITAIIGFYVKRAYVMMDNMSKDFVDHRINDAKEYITHQELKELKDDIRGMISSVNSKLASIEVYLREDKKH
jgi:hypothetical protein